MKICQFVYNGMFIHQDEEVTMEYDVEFKEWTEDPGIFLGICSDGIERLIPECSVVEGKELIPEMPVFEEGSKVGYWGIPSSSN